MANNDISKLAVVLTARQEGFTSTFQGAGKDVGRFASQVEGAAGGIGSFLPMLGKVGLAGAAIGAALSVGSAIGSGVKLAAEFEQVSVAMTTIIGDAATAKTVLSDLTTFAAETPFEFPELADASKKLLAFGQSADTVVPALRAIGDISAGIGAPISEIAELYGKARVQGRLFAQDINQLVNRGIPIIQELAKQFGTTESAVKGLVESGQVTFANLQKAFVDLTTDGGKFEGMMKAQSQTLGGLWSTAVDNVNLKLRGLGETLVETFAVKDLLAGFNELMGGGAEQKSAADVEAEKQKAAADANAAVEKARQDRIGQAIADTTKKLQEQIDTYGMSKEQIDLWKLSQEGATAAQLKQASAMVAQIAALDAQKKAAEEAAKAQEELAKSVERWADFAIDPLEKLDSQLLEIDRLKGQGLLTDEQAASAGQRLAEQFGSQIAKATEKVKLPDVGRNFFGQNIAAIERRFTGGFARSQPDKIEQLRKINERAAKAAERTARATEAIAKGDEDPEEVVRL